MAKMTYFAALLMAVSTYAASLEHPALETRQSSVMVTVCNSYDQNTQKCGGNGECHDITLTEGTYASTPGTICWYIAGNTPHPDPSMQPYSGRLKFCNDPAGGGECHTADTCHVAPDGSCDASGTESMGLNA